MGLDPAELLDAVRIDFSDISYEEKSSDADEATVHVTGGTSLDFDSDKLESFFKKAVEATGQEMLDFLSNEQLFELPLP